MDAKLTITYNGEQGDLPDPVNFDAPDADIRFMVTEALRAGGIPGVRADANADLTDFVIDRFAPKDDLPARISLRPKTPFGEV